MFDLISALWTVITENPIPFSIGIIVAIILITDFQIRLNKRAANNFEAAYGFKPDSHLDPLRKVVYLTLNAEWKKVEQARHWEQSAFRHFGEGQTPAEILERRAHYEESLESRNLAHHEFGLKLKLAIRFGYVDDQSYFQLDPAIGTFAQEHSFYATA